MMEVIVLVCDAFGLTVSEKKTETMCMPAPHMLPVEMHVEANGQRIDKLNPLYTSEESSPNAQTSLRR